LQFIRNRDKIANVARTPAATELQRLAARCRRQGLPLTVQRRTLLEELLARRDHPTAEQLFAAVSARLPGVARATVYRNLETLLRAGVLRKVWHAGAAARYEVSRDRHHHLVCVVCDKVRDVHLAALDRLPRPSAPGFLILDYSVHFMGVCRDCASSASRRARQLSLRRVEDAWE